MDRDNLFAIHVVADKARRPLYYLHTEELGTTPKAIGKNLSKASALATAFNAVLLLDGACNNFEQAVTKLMSLQRPIHCYANDRLSISHRMD